MTNDRDNPSAVPPAAPDINDPLPDDIAAVAQRLDRLAASIAAAPSPELLDRLALVAAAEARGTPLSAPSDPVIAGRIAPRLALFSRFRSAPMRIAAVLALAAGASILLWTIRPPAPTTLATNPVPGSDPASPSNPLPAELALAPEKAAAFDSLLAAVEWTGGDFDSISADLDSLAQSVAETDPWDDPTGMLEEGSL